MSNEENEEELRLQLENKIGQKVEFRFPKSELMHEGRIVDRFVSLAPDWTGIRNFNIIDRIQFEKPK